MIRFCIAFIALAVLVQSAFGQEPEVEKDWRDHVIPVNVRSFDFQTVPKGATPVHQFVLRNPFHDPIHIVAVTSSCTCTTLDFDEEKSILKTYEEAIIAVRLRGDLFDGARNSTITVTLDKPGRTEIQFNVRGEIRSDLTISPTFIDFGNVELGQGRTRSLVVTYTGPNSQWRLVNAQLADAKDTDAQGADAQEENKFIHAEITAEPARVGVRVFRVNVSLDKDAPNGVLNTHLVLTSNDALHRREIPIPIRATVGPVINVRPPAVSLGILPAGERSPVREAILSGTQPFRVLKVESDNPAVEITSRNPPDALARMHMLSITYQNPTEGEGAPEDGIMRAVIRVTTDVPGLTPTFYATATVRE